MSAVTVRAAALDDLPALREVLMHQHRFHAERIPDRIRIPPAEGLRSFDEHMERTIEGPDATMLVAERDGGLVGAAMLRFEAVADNPFRVPRRTCLVENLVVVEGERRAGVGMALDRASEEWARAHGADELQLTVYEFPEGARPFYEKAGYRIIRYQMGKDL